MRIDEIFYFSKIILAFIGLIYHIIYFLRKKDFIVLILYIFVIGSISSFFCEFGNKCSDGRNFTERYEIIKQVEKIKLKINENKLEEALKISENILKKEPLS
jgi:hypothetical protein